MRVVIQRAKNAKCTVDGQITGQIDYGYCIFVGFNNEDTNEIIDKMIHKILFLRIFEDENGKMNKSIQDVEGSILSISQFTLYADCKKGNRPLIFHIVARPFSLSVCLFFLKSVL